ncbi:MAG: hypothetical protein V4555_15030 [Acidobacteriota bacterium]
MFQCPAPIINLPPAPPNHEWLKILASAGLGLLAGLIADPVKNHLQRRHDAKVVMSAIEADLKALLNLSFEYREQGVDDVNFWPIAAIPAYTHFKESRGDLFYEHKNLAKLGQACEGLLHQIRANQRGSSFGNLDGFQFQIAFALNDWVIRQRVDAHQGIVRD